VLLVTGRRLDELRRAAGDLYFVDGVVRRTARSSIFSPSGHTTVLAPPVPPRYLVIAGDGPPAVRAAR
jgi:hypothetical protein